MGNPGADWVKLEVLRRREDVAARPHRHASRRPKSWWPKVFRFLVYTSDDAVVARRLKQAGATSVMPAGSPIGSGQGVLNPNAIRICLEYLKDGDPDYPVIVDAGVGTASDVTMAMELGVDGVLLNTGIAHAKDPLGMARAMRSGDRIRPLGLPGRPHPQEALRYGQQPAGRPDCAGVAETEGSSDNRRSPRFSGQTVGLSGKM